MIGLIPGLLILFIWGIGLILLFLILHLVIRSAIEKSEMHETLKEVRRLLKEIKEEKGTGQ